MRSENATKNAVVSVGARVTEQILAFVSRTVFIWFLSVEYLGVTSLFSNILNVLNVAELGISMAINVALYKPLADNDKEKIKAYMKLYRKAYFFVGLAVLVIGVALVPFLPYLMKGTTDVVNVTVIYLIYVAKSVLSYWVYAYKRTLLEADQKGYYVNLISYSLICIFKVIQILLLYLLKDTPELSFYVYCLNDLVVTLVNNIVISLFVNKKYPYIKEKSTHILKKEEKKDLAKNVYGVALYKISSTLNSAADSIIISSFIGTVILGLYSNYLLIATAIMTVLNMLFVSITSSIGNLNVTESVEKKREIFDDLHLIGFWIYGFCVICLWVLLNPFLVSVWLGPEYRLGELVIFTMCMNYLVDGVMISPVRFRNACGLYWQSRYRAVAVVFVNVALSILAVTVFDLGIPGILLATIISRLAVTLWIDTNIVHKHVLKTSPKKYYAKYFMSLLLVIVTGGIIKLICFWMPEESIIFFFVRMILCIIIPNLLWWLIFHKTPEYAYFIKLIKNLLSKVKKIFTKKKVKNI